MTVREYLPSDFEACRLLHIELTQHHRDIYEDQSIGGDNPSWWFEGLIESPALKGVWVAEVDGKAVGFTALLVDGDRGEIEPVIVTRHLRAKGIGSQLVAQAVKATRDAGVQYLSVKPVARNDSAIRFFVRLGFDRLGQIELNQDLSGRSPIRWKPGVEIHGAKLDY